MAISFDLLPVEIQASVVELRAAQVDQAIIDALVTRTVHALGVTANRVQVEVLDMEARLGDQLRAIGVKLHADTQTQHGATNEMLADLRSLIEEAGQVIAGLKKESAEMDEWRGRVEAHIGGIMEARDQSLQERADLRAADARLDTRLVEIEQVAARIDERLAVVEQVLEIEPKAGD